MQTVIAITPVNPMRREPSHRSEMVSQLLFGELAILLEKSGDFSKIRSIFDGYEGWVQNMQLMSMEDGSKDWIFSGYSLDTATIRFNHRPMNISAGTPIWQTEEIGGFKVEYGKLLAEKSISFNETNLKKVVTPYINASYLWGGRSSFGLDCSGFVQQIFKLFGHDLARDTYQQAELGMPIGFLEESKLGDLAFFDNADGKIIHVGILLDTGHILHASGNVRIDRIDAQGILNEDRGVRTHQLRIIKRLL